MGFKKDLEHKGYKKIFVTKFTKKLDYLIISVKHNFFKIKGPILSKIDEKNFYFEFKKYFKRQNI